LWESNQITITGESITAEGGLGGVRNIADVVELRRKPSGLGPTRTQLSACVGDVSLSSRL